MSTAISGRELESFFGNEINTTVTMSSTTASRPESVAFHTSKYFVCPEGKDVPIPDMILREKKAEKKKEKAHAKPAAKPAPVILSRQGPPQGSLPNQTEIVNKETIATPSDITPFVPAAPAHYQQAQFGGPSQTQRENANNVLAQFGLMPSK